MLALLICGSALVVFGAGVFAGAVMERAQTRVRLHQTALHLAVHRMLDTEALAMRSRGGAEKLDGYRAARRRVVELVGWEPPPVPTPVYRRNVRASSEERPAC